MATRIFSSKSLELPADVKVPEEIYIHGNLRGDHTELVVLKQLEREVLVDAFVCHIQEGPWGMGIYDMPNYYFIRVGDLRTKVAEGMKFTMANVKDEIRTEERLSSGITRANWLY